MTDQITPSGATHDSADGTARAAREVAGRGAERASDVAGEAMTEAKAVAREAKDHVRNLVDRSRQDMNDEATARSRQAAGAVRTFADRVGALADGDPEAAGPLADLAREGRDRLAQFAARLDEGPTAVLEDVRRFARRQPMLFLASAGALGFIAGRLVRAGREQGSASTTATSYPTGTMPRPVPATAMAPPATVSPVVPPADVVP